MNIYLSSSWKNRDLVRKLAIQLRDCGYEVYDFTDSNCRRFPELPPELVKESFNPDNKSYYEYLTKPEFVKTIFENRQAIIDSDVIVLLLPCGIDATADWALGVGLGKPSLIVGHPKEGEQSPVHLWATNIVETIEEIIPWLKMIEHANCLDCVFNETSDDNSLFKNCDSLCSISEEIFTTYDDFELPKHCGHFKPVMYCRICGCTEHFACPGGCFWIEPGLCSQCANKEVIKK